MKGSWFEAGPGKKHRTLPKKITEARGAWLLTSQIQGPEFKPQCCQKKKKEKDPHYMRVRSQ
jgi:hypothetical protein